MSFATSLGLLLLGLFVLPVLVGGCLPKGRDGVPWYEARRDPTGLAPDPAGTPEAVVQVYAARAVSWRGVVAVHTWIAVKPTGAGRYTRYEGLRVSGFALRPCRRAPRCRRRVRAEPPRAQYRRRRRSAGAKAAGDRPIRAGPLMPCGHPRLGGIALICANSRDVLEAPKHGMAAR